MTGPTWFQRGCICKGTGAVDVVSDGKSFFTFFKEALPAGRTVVVACNCRLGEELNEKRAENLKFSVYDPETMTFEGQKAPARAKRETEIAVRKSDEWGLPAYDPANYGGGDVIEGECEQVDF